MTAGDLFHGVGFVVGFVVFGSAVAVRILGGR